MAMFGSKEKIMEKVKGCRPVRRLHRAAIGV